MTFTVGETVVYPNHGAAVIEAMETRTIRGEDKLYPKGAKADDPKAFRIYAEKCPNSRGVRRVLEAVQLADRPTIKIRKLSGGQRQSVAIARAIHFNARILIMDEPTASLSAHEVARLLDIARALKAQGVAVIYISHLLDEIFRIADRVTPVNGQAVVQPMTTLTLSCDHRVVDGARAAQFMQTLVASIEDPLSVLD